ncbi:MAG TPA: hypothetical protein VMT05_08420 [Terriglobales bacterium]|jgi:hypothetical protein|nr:hypothetical protein [Terriglobales bacterium]
MPKWVCLSALLALCIPVSLSASSKVHKKQFKITEPTQVRNVVLAPGHYEVTWTRMGTNVPVTIYRHKKIVVAVPDASVVEEETPYNTGALVTEKNLNGAQELKEIEFSKVAVMLPPHP